MLALVSSHTLSVARSRLPARLASGRAARMSADVRPQSVGRVRPFIIGIGGGSASGKTTVVETIMEKIGAEGRVISISQDCFYKGLSAEDRANVAHYNFDHPAAMDFDEQVELLRALQQGATDVRVPQYDFCTHARLHPSLDTPVHAPEIVIFEGILALHDPRLRDLFDLSIYVDTDADLRLMRRIQRDIESRGRTLGSVVEQYERFVKPSHDQFIEPCRKTADIVVPFNRRNLVAIELICDHIDLLRARCTKLAEDFHDLASARSAGLQPAPTLHAPPAMPVNGRVQPTANASGRPAQPLM
jgi:uridine kinase